MVKYDYPLYQIVASTVLDKVHVNDIVNNPEEIPEWWHIYYGPDVVDYEIRGKLDDTGNNIIELKFVKDKDGIGGTYTRTLYERQKIEKEKRKRT